MKSIKTILKSLLVIALLVMQLVPNFAYALKGTNSDDGKITIDNAISGKKYSVYQILKLESYDTDKNAYSYKATDSWSSFINSSAIKGVYVNVDNQGYVTWVENADVDAFVALALAHAKENTSTISATDSKTASSTTVEFTGLNLGYYLLDSSVGALCGIHTTAKEVVIKEKNAEPTISKEVQEDSTSAWGKENTASIGETVYFRTTVNVEAGAEKYVLTDTMDAGLTLNADSITVKLVATDATTTITGSDKFSVTTSAHGFVITFVDAYLKDKAGKSLLVEYSAVLNENAVVYNSANVNDTYLTYGDDNSTTHDTTKTYTYKFEIVKTDKDNEVIEGARFLLLDKNGTIIPVYKVSGNVYRVADITVRGDTFEGVEIEAGTAIIEGLDADNYQLQETKAPEGYNILAANKTFTISDNNVVATYNADDNSYVAGTGVQVINYTGSLLPSTGSVGTTLFITIGSLMTLGFGVILVTKYRMKKEQEI